jgi:hypothetical protein
MVAECWAWQVAPHARHAASGLGGAACHGFYYWKLALRRVSFDVESIQRAGKGEDDDQPEDNDGEVRGTTAGEGGAAFAVRAVDGNGAGKSSVLPLCHTLFLPTSPRVATVLGFCSCGG